MVKKSLLLTIIVISGLSCNERNKYNNTCGEISVRLLSSILVGKYSKFKSQPSQTDLEDMIVVFDRFREMNGKLIERAGGFTEGKTLGMVYPCRPAVEIVDIFNEKSLAELNNDLIESIGKSGLMNDGQIRNTQFVIESYFNDVNGPFQEERMGDQNIGYIALEFFTYQLVILDLLELSSLE